MFKTTYPFHTEGEIVVIVFKEQRTSAIEFIAVET